MSEHSVDQDQDTKYKIIIEPNEPLAESDETHQDDANSFGAMDDADGDEEDAVDEPKYQATGTRPPP